MRKNVREETEESFEAPTDWLMRQKMPLQVFAGQWELKILGENMQIHLKTS